MGVRTRCLGAFGKRSKFNAKPTVVDGIRFASGAEARRYCELKVLQKAGHIRDLKCHPKYDLSVSDYDGDQIKIGSYVADFRYYTEDGGEVVEDVKGFKTELYRWKKKHMEAEHGIVVKEIRA